MGFFTKTEMGPIGGPLPALRHETIEAVLDGWGASYATDGDGDLGGFWDGHLFYFLRDGREGTVLTVRGRWNRTVGPEEHDRLVGLINDWHAEKIWPKAYVRAEGEYLGVYADLSTTLGAGATQAQVDDLMSCALATSLQLFEHLDEQYPEAAAAAAAAMAEQEAAAGDPVDGEPG